MTSETCGRCCRSQLLLGMMTKGAWNHIRSASAFEIEKMHDILRTRNSTICIADKIPTTTLLRKKSLRFKYSNEDAFSLQL